MTEWEIHGTQFSNCNCDVNCPCQFSMPAPTHGHCMAVAAGQIDRGRHGETDLSGLRYVMILKWPGPIPEGNGTEQFVIEERATAEQRTALERILSGGDTEPFATVYHVFNATCSKVLDTVFAPIAYDCDIPARRGSFSVAGLVESRGEPIIDGLSGEPHRVQIGLPNGFEYRIAEIGQGSTQVTGDLQFQLKDSYGQFCELHLGGSGVLN